MLWLMLEVRHSVLHMWQNMVIAAVWLIVKILALIGPKLAKLIKESGRIIWILIAAAIFQVFGA